jgi:hypothetical protein
VRRRHLQKCHAYAVRQLAAGRRCICLQSSPVAVSAAPTTGIVPNDTSTKPLLALLMNSASSGGDVMGFAALGDPGPTMTCNTARPIHHKLTGIAAGAGMTSIGRTLRPSSRHTHMFVVCARKDVRTKGSTICKQGGCRWLSPG